LKFPITSIIVKDRARKDFGDLSELKSSISRRGLINPICIDDQNQLIAGERRLRCHVELGLLEIEVKYYKDLTPIEKKEMELEENLHKTLTWYEKAALRAEIHAAMVEIHGSAIKGHESNGWSQVDTAEALGISKSVLSQDVALVETSKLLPKIAKFQSKRQAVKHMAKANELAILGELALRDKGGKQQTVPYTIKNMNALDYLKELDDEVIDMVICDPPWGIDADIKTTGRGTGGDKTDFLDSFENAENLARKLIPELYRVMKPNTHMYLFCGGALDQRIFWETLVQNPFNIPQDSKHKDYIPMDSADFPGFKIRNIPLIWLKESGAYTDFEVKFMPRYENFLFCSKGLRRLNNPSSDIFEFSRPSSVQRIHTAQKPIELLQQAIRLSTVPQEIVLDPCMGSGASIIAATVCNRRSIGIEMGKNNFLRAKDWIHGMNVDEVGKYVDKVEEENSEEKIG